MQKYFTIGLTALFQQGAYRLNYLIKLIKPFFSVLVTVLMWRFIYQGHSEVNGLNFQQLVLYLILTNLLALIFSSSPTLRFAGQIKDGTLTTMLIRPLSVYGEAMANYLGAQSVGLGLMVLVELGLVSFKSFKNFFLALIFLVATFVMMFTLFMSLGLLAFWLINIWPLRSAINALYLLLGGLYFPLTFLGKNWYAVLRYNPFSLATNSNAQIVLSGGNYANYSQDLIAVVIWIVILLVIYQVGLHKGLKKYEGVGV